MSSEWLPLTASASNKHVFINMANANAIFPNGKGLDIWFLTDASREGKIQVEEAPEVILTRLAEIRRTHRA
jgi:hypothetical protein